MNLPYPRSIPRLRVLCVVSGLALLGALGPATPASAEEIEVTTEVDEVSPNGECSLREAIFASDENVSLNEDCLPGDIGHDTIELAEGGEYLLTIGDFFVEDNPPALTGDLDIYDGGEGAFRSPGRAAMQNVVLTIEGNGSVIDASELEHSPEIPAPDRIFHVQAGFGVVINNLTIQGGGGPFDITGDDDGPTPVDRGGGILVEPEGGAELHGSVVRQNQADDGGGIYNDQGHVELLDGSVVGGNSPDDANFAALEGGGIFTVGGPTPETLILDASSVDGNVAGTHGGGIYNGGEQVAEGDRVEIRNGSSVSGNISGGVCLGEDSPSGGGNGGGIWTNAQADLAAPPVREQPPPTEPGSPGLFVDASTVANNQAFVCGEGFGGDGAGIYNLDPGDVFLTGGAEIGPDNLADRDGGGIWTGSDNSLYLDETTVTGNSAGNNGGGIFNLFDTVQIHHSTIDSNTAGQLCDEEGCEVTGGDGGGIWTVNPCEPVTNGLGRVAQQQCEGATLIGNSTISGNQALAQTEGNNSGHGGGIYLGQGELVLDSATVNANFADIAGGNIAMGNGGAKAVFLGNTIVANGEISELPTLRGAALQVEQNCFSDGAPFISLGFNLTDGPENHCGIGPAPGDIFGEDPNLGPLRHNISPSVPKPFTQTHALRPGSPGIDAGAPVVNGENGSPPRGSTLQPSEAACPADDQRGVSRPRDGDGDGDAVCDIGAYERRPVESAGGGGGPGQPGGPLPPGPPPGALDEDAPCTIYGTSGNDFIIGTPGDDVICPGAGNDTVFADPPGPSSPRLAAPKGVGGNDIVRAGTGRDRVFGGPGHDLLRGFKGADRLNGGPGHDKLVGAKGRDLLRGKGGRDLILGNKGKDRLHGGPGRDLLKGGARPDIMNGGKGNDECRDRGRRNRLRSCERGAIRS